MTSIIVTNNTLTIKRMSVIAHRAGSELMAGAKAMMIENLKKQMKNGLAHFVYLKKDGSVREAFGTTNEALVSKFVDFLDHIVIYQGRSNEDAGIRPLAQDFSAGLQTTHPSHDNIHQNKIHGMP